MAHILIVATLATERTEWARLCRARGHRVSQADSTAAALEACGLDSADVALVDLDLPDGGGWCLLEDLTRRVAPARVIAHSAAARIEDVVNAMRAGAFHFLERPTPAEAFLAAVEQALPSRGADDAAEGLEQHAGLGAMLGHSAAIRRVYEQVRRVSRTPSTTTLITGESGVGKEMVARAIHDHSARAQGPFVAINCAALADTLVEAELFGYEPGAFTGGQKNGRTGLICAAEGGTLLLDEIGEMAPQLQAKLLRVLQERCYRPIGGRRDIPMNVRIVASTNRDLLAMVETGAFREDLYYRLNVLSIQVPPLRERHGDIPQLAGRFLQDISRELAREFEGYAPEAMERLRSNPWAGNVRELKNTVERAAIFAEGSRIEADDLGCPDPATTTTRDSSCPSLPLESLRLRDVEQKLIEHVLGEVDGNRSRAARELGINRTTLYNKLRSYGIAT